MNIFVLDYCPEKAAEMLCNKHLVKMPTEGAQILCYAFPQGEPPLKNDQNQSHSRHPVVLWSKESSDNFRWLLTHAKAQSEVYTKRYKRIHASSLTLTWIERNLKYISFPEVGLTPFARCFSSFKDELESEPDTVEAYRKFYKLDKPFARWPSLAAIPDWWGKDEKFVDKNFIDGNYIKR